MSVYTATVIWSRDGAVFTDGRYSRAHTIAFDGGISIDGSSSPSVVGVPMSREDAVDPEEMLVASLSACHMLFFTDFARRAGFTLDRYADAAEGVMGKDDRGRMAMTSVTLNPALAWSGDKVPAHADITALHHKAHAACFIANSFRGDVHIAGVS